MKIPILLRILAALTSTFGVLSAWAAEPIDKTSKTEPPLSVSGKLPFWAKSELSKGCDPNLLPEMYWSKRLPGKDLQIRCLFNNRWVVAPLNLPLAFSTETGGKPTHVTFFPKLQDGVLLNAFLRAGVDSRSNPLNWHTRQLMTWWGKPLRSKVQAYDGWLVFRIPGAVKIQNWCGWPEQLSWEAAVEQGGPVVCGDVVDNEYRVRSFNFDVSHDVHAYGWLTERAMSPVEANAELSKLKQLINTTIKK